MPICPQNILEICWDTFPWICNQAISVGRRRRDNRLCKLGGELFILTQEILFISDTKSYPKLVDILGLVSKACSRGRDDHTDVLRQMVDFQQMSTVNDHKSLVIEIQESLAQFVAKDAAYPILLQLIRDSLRGAEIEETLQQETRLPLDNNSEYPAHVNNTLYNQLERYSICSCSSDHLRSVRLRLEPEAEREKGDVSFDFLFVANPSSTHQPSRPAIRWKEAQISVDRHRQLKRKGRVGFQTDLNGSGNPDDQLAPGALKTMGLGDFCKLIKGQPNIRVYFHIHNNTMNVSEPVKRTKPRNMLPSDGTPLAQWLGHATHIPKRVKVILAYTVARSVWQYYNSNWMRTPWTHDNIQFLQEQNQTTDDVKPHLFFVTRLISQQRAIQDFHTGDDLVHIYPNILALGVILIEIATGKPFKPDNETYQWDHETTLNDYYDWAFTTAQSGDLRKAVGAKYESVVKSCLDDAAFRDGPVDFATHAETCDLRRLRLFEQIVSPLEELYQAYRDDWGLQDLPAANTNSLGSDLIRTERDSVLRSVGRDKFTVAVFCALSAEADSVVELFDYIWAERTYGKAPGDDNYYTLGRIGPHNVVLVHMAGMGKGVACQAASSARFSYPSIKLALVVGICGGVPLPDRFSEILLGDVVISSSIVQYDLGRQYPDSFASRPSHEVHRYPPRELQSLLSKLRSTRERRALQNRICDYLLTRRKEPGQRKTSYPGPEQDVLFPPDYHHKHRYPDRCRGCSIDDRGPHSVCEEARIRPCMDLGCDRGFQIHRTRLREAIRAKQAPQLKVHIGRVGSGDTVMKSGLHRDATAKYHGLIAFEMEASGICDVFPAIIIKGICDYSDSHKDKDWQDYASVTAAACMKAFLEEWAG